MRGHNKKTKKNKYAIYMSTLIILLFLFIISLIFIKYINGSKYYTAIIISIFIVLLSGIIFVREKQVSLKEKEEIEKYYNNLKQNIIVHVSGTSENSINNSNQDVIELMINNMREINEYYVMSKKMTLYSFILAVSMCIGGFVIISASVVFILINQIEMSQGIIPVVSGTIVEAIAATTLVVYKKSLEQLNRYYDSLHDNEMFLSSVNLASKMSIENRNDIYNYIIKTKLEKNNFN